MKILRRVDWRLLAFGLLAYVAFLTLTFPAERAYAYWKQQAGGRAPVALGGISGSVWAGHADQALINGQRLEALHWRLHPWALFAGQVAADWSLKVDDGYGRGEAAAGLGGAVSLDSLEARLPLAQLPVKALAALRPAGTLSLNLHDVKWDGTALVSASGRVVWNGAGINLFQALEFGDLSLTLETAADEVKGVLADAGGPLQAQGLLSLKPDGSYQFTGSFAARGQAPELARALRTLGRMGSDGKVHISQKGTLAALGLVPRRP
jgi:hypothetical protein